MDAHSLWQLYGSLRELADRDRDAALAEIDKHRAQCRRSGFSPIFVLQAETIARGGRPDDYALAIEILFDAAKIDAGNFWIFHNLGRYLVHVGRIGEAVAAIRQSHRLVGWDESAQKGYTFTHDYFSMNIPQWQKWFAELITMQPIECLEIGSWQGASATWLLDKIVSARGGMLTCVDPFTGNPEHANISSELGASLEEIFDANIKASGHQHLCRKIVGTSQDRLRTLAPGSIDFLYIDGAHEAKFVIQDAILALPLLRQGGFVLFDDFDTTFPDNPRQNAARAIEFFLDVFDDEFTCLGKNRQVLLRKN